MSNYIVVDEVAEWPVAPKNAQIISALEYLKPREPNGKCKHSIINLCCDQSYQSLGYYVSLLAMARKHSVAPQVGVFQDIKSRGYLASISDDLKATTSQVLKNYNASTVEFEILFGSTEQDWLERLGKKIFSLLHTPWIEVRFEKKEDLWILRRIENIDARRRSKEQKEHLFQHIAQFFQKKNPRKKLRSYRYDMAILCSSEAGDTPSNTKALEKFIKAGERTGVNVEIIHKEDYNTLYEYDALFIRETTAVNHHTYRFARKAQAEDLVVIDDPESILRCTNKVFLAELLKQHKIPQPETFVLSKKDVHVFAEQAVYPLVLKPPDGSFSIGTSKVESTLELEREATRLFKDSELILAQTFMPTDYDWRITVIDRKPLFACRYYMAKGHWQVVKREGSRSVEGDFDALPVELAPESVVRTALMAANLIGNGLYGVDLKERDKKAYVIEVNDNPNIDAGIEDRVLKDGLYDRILSVFVDRMERQRRAKES